MHIHYLSEENSVLNHFGTRNVDVHTDSMRFRRNIERIGEIMAYELSKSYTTKCRNTNTIRNKKTTEIQDQLLLCSILRAGLPLHMGFKLF
jgi:uracil phosphoribosyltransferase